MPCPDLLRSRGPDSTESWLVALATWWSFIFSYAFYRSYSVVYLCLTRTHGLSRQDASAGFVSLVTSSCLFGIIAGCLERKYSIRSINFVSSIICSVSVFILYFDISKYAVLLTCAIYGLGRSALGNLCTALVSRHFVKMQTAAVGFSYSGISLAGIIFPIVLQSLTETYGFRGCCLLLSGISLNACVGACFHREPSTAIKKEQNAAVRAFKTDAKDAAHHQEVTWTPAKTSVINKMTQNSVCKTREEEDEEAASLIHQQSDSNILNTSDVDINCAANDECQSVVLNTAFQEEHQPASVQSSECPLENSSCEGSVSVKRSNFLIKYVLPVRLVLSEGMFYICLFGFFCLIILGIVFTIILDVAVDKGVEEKDTALILTTFAIADIIASLTVGLISGSGRRRTKFTTMVVQMFGGLCVLSVTFAHGFALMTVVAAGIGITNGLLNVLVSVMMAEYLGKGMMPITMGLCMLFGGILSWLAPPLIGYYRDVQENYNPLLIECGGAMLLTGLLWILEPWVLAKSKLYKTVDTANSKPDNV